MKAFRFLLITISILSLSACSLEDETHYNNYNIAFATVSEPNASNGTFYLYLDDSTRLFTQEIAESLTSAAVPAEGLRVLVNYVQLDKVTSSVYDYNIKINDFTPVLIDSIKTLTESNKDSIGNDRWGKILLYAGADYLNVIAGYVSLGTDIDHQFSLVQNTLKVYDDYPKVHLELLYNAGGDATTSGEQASISFDLSSLKSLYPDSLNLVIDTYQIEADSLTSYAFTYKWRK